MKWFLLSQAEKLNVRAGRCVLLCLCRLLVIFSLPLLHLSIPSSLLYYSSSYSSLLFLSSHFFAVHRFLPLSFNFLHSLSCCLSHPYFLWVVWYSSRCQHPVLYSAGSHDTCLLLSACCSSHSAVTQHSFYSSSSWCCFHADSLRLSWFCWILWSVIIDVLTPQDVQVVSQIVHQIVAS